MSILLGAHAWKTIDRKSFERGNFLVLRPVLLKIAYFNSGNRQLSIAILAKELRQRQIVDPSRALPWCSVEGNFSVFSQKIKRAVIFYLLGNPAETGYLKGLCHRYRYMNGWYGNVYDKAPMLSISIQIARTKNMRLYCGRGTSNPVSGDIAPLKLCPSSLFAYSSKWCLARLQW